MKPFARINLSSVALAKGEALAKGDALRMGSRARYRAIAKGEPVVCVHCGAKIETK